MFSEDTGQEDEDYFMDSSTSSFKRLLFLSLTPLLFEEYFNQLIKLLILLIETLQLMSFSFKPLLLSLWNSSSQITLISDFFKYFLFMSYVNSSSFSLYLVFFYLIVGFAVVVLILLVYLNYKADEGVHKTKSMNVNGFAFQLAKAIFEIMPQILYLPMLEVLVEIFNCSFDPTTAQWKHLYFDNVVCYENLYFLHIFLGGVTIIALMGFTAMITIIFYEPRLKNNSFFAKTTGNIDFFSFAYKTALVGLFIASNNTSSLLVIAVLTIFPFFLFLKYRQDQPYFNILASKAYLLHYSFITWTGFALMFNRIVQDVTFDANLYIFFVGLGLLVAIIILRRDFRYELLLINVNKIDSLDTFYQHTHYLLFLCEHYKSDPALAVLLDGFVQFHKTICQDNECPCKKDQSLLFKSRKNKEFSFQDGQIIRVFALINVFFINMMQKKPFNSGLRIRYSQFLLDKMDQKQLALQEILTASRFKPNFSEEFLIFRFKRIIEAELLEKKKEDSISLQGFAMETVNELALNSIVKQIKGNIEKAATQHLEFWSQLSEDVPDLSKLREIGTRINSLNSLLEEDWERFIRMNVVLPSLYRLYAGFLFTIHNDKIGSARIYSKLEAEGVDKGKSMKNTLAAEIVNNSAPVLFISGDEGSMGMITNLNQAAAALFGYNKSELLNKRLDLLQPASIAEKHNTFIENYVQKSETRMLNRELVLPMKDKNGYLKPVFVTARSVPFSMQGLQFFGTIRQEKTFKTYMYLYCDSEGIIELFSTSCLSFVNLDKKKLAKRRNSITEIVPGFFDHFDSFLVKQGALADVQIQAKVAYTLTHYTTTMPPTLNNQNSNVKGLNAFPSNQDSQQNISSNELSASNLNLNNDDVIQSNMPQDKNLMLPVRLPVNIQIFENQQFGLKNLLVRIEYMEKHTPKPVVNRHLLPPNSRTDAMNQKNSMFAMTYDIYFGGYRGEIMEGDNREIEEYMNFLQTSHFSGRSMIENSEIMGKESESVRANSRLYKKLEENFLLKEKEKLNLSGYELKDWGKGIRTYRLLGDRVFDVEELKREEESEGGSEENVVENEEKNIKKEEKGRETQEKEDFGVNLKNSRNIFKSRSNFSSFLKRLKREKSALVRNLHLFAIVSLVLLAVVSSVDHFTMSNQFSMNQQSYQLMDWSNQRISEAELVLFNIVELQLLGAGLYNGIASNDYETTLRADLISSIASLDTLQNELILNGFGFSAAHQALTTKDIIVTYFMDSTTGQVTTELFDINQITSQIISKAYSLASEPLSYIANGEYESDFFFVKFNIFNDYYLALREESAMFLSELQSRITENSSVLLIILLLSALVLLLSLVTLLPLYSFALNSHQELLLIFLDLSPGQVKRNFGRCETFLNHLQVGEEEQEDEASNEENSDVSSGKDEESHLREGFSGLTNSRKRKKYKLSNRSRFFFFWKVLTIFCMLEAFFIASYSITNLFSSQITSIVKELNVTSIAESHFSFANNILRQCIMDPSFNITGESGVASTMMDNYTDILISLVSTIEKLHSIDLGYQDASYNAIFDQIFSNDLCPQLFPLLEPTCSSFADGSLTQGFSLTLYRFIDSFRQMKVYIDTYTAGNLSNLVSLLNLSSSQTFPRMDLLIIPIQIENNQLQTTYIKTTFRYLMSNQLDTLKSTYSNTMNTRLILYVCLFIMLVMVYLGFWVPVTSQLNFNLYKIKKMLAIIPLEIIQGNREIRENIQNILNIHD